MESMIGTFSASPTICTATSSHFSLVDWLVEFAPWSVASTDCSGSNWPICTLLEAAEGSEKKGTPIFMGLKEVIKVCITSR